MQKLEPAHRETDTDRRMTRQTIAALQSYADRITQARIDLERAQRDLADFEAQLIWSVIGAVQAGDLPVQSLRLSPWFARAMRDQQRNIDFGVETAHVPTVRAKRAAE